MYVIFSGWSVSCMCSFVPGWYVLLGRKKTWEWQCSSETFARTIPDNLRALHMKMWGFEAQKRGKFTRTSCPEHYHGISWPCFLHPWALFVCLMKGRRGSWIQLKVGLVLLGLHPRSSRQNSPDFNALVREARNEAGCRYRVSNLMNQFSESGIRGQKKGPLQKGPFIGGVSGISKISIENGRILLYFSTLCGFSKISRISKFFRISRVSNLKRPLFQKTPFSEPEGWTNPVLSKPCLCLRDTRHFRVICVVFGGLRSEALVFQWVECKSVIFAAFVKTAPFWQGAKTRFTKNTACATPRQRRRQVRKSVSTGVWCWGTANNAPSPQKTFLIRWYF